MRNLIVSIALFLSACAAEVEFSIPPGEPVHVRSSSVEKQLGPSDLAYQTMSEWISRNQEGWSPSYATNPSGGVFVWSGQWQVQFVGSVAYLSTEQGLLTKQVKESEYAFLK